MKKIKQIVFFFVFISVNPYNASFFPICPSILPHQQIRSGSECDDLNHQQHREEHPEIPVLRLVMKNLHTEHTAQSSKERCHQEQPLLWNTPLALTGTLLVIAHQHKGDYVHYRNDGQRHQYNRLLMMLFRMIV